MEVTKGKDARPRWGDTRGMTLIEVMFAAGVLATGLSLLFGALVSMSLVSEVTRGRAIATTELSSILEDLRKMPYAELLKYAPPKVEHPQGSMAVSLVCFKENGDKVPLPAPSGTAPGSLPNPLEVLAIVNWTDSSGRTYTVTGSTFHGR